MFSKNHRTARLKHPHLPWLIGAVAFMVYLVTVCYQVTPASLSLVAQVNGWSGSTQVDRPLLWLITVPVKLLPARWVPLVLNLQSATLAAFTLVLLARSVQLLPLNRSRLQLLFMRSDRGIFDRQDAWLPVVVACLACALELGFWQEAVANSGEMLDAFLFMLAVWCVVEYSVSEDLAWLDRLAFVWGVGMVQNWAMLGATPVFIATLITFWGMAFLAVSLWLRVLWRLAVGASLVLVLPLVNSLAPHASWTFKHAVKETALAMLAQLHLVNSVITNLTMLSLVIGLYFFLPVVPILLRMRQEGSYHTSLQARLQLLIFQIIYPLMLLTELWVTLHPMVGPQSIIRHNSGLPPTLLSLVILNALGIGYLTAHFLLICGADLEELRRRSPQFRLPPFLPEWLRKTVVPLLYMLPVILAGALLARNVGFVWNLNRSALTGFGEATVACLPTTGGILVGDDSQRLQVVLAALARRPDYPRWARVDTTRLADPAYRADLQRKWPLGWTNVGPHETLSHAGMTELLFRMATTNRVYYAHPSFGFFFEYMDAEPHGLVFKVTQAKSKDAASLPLSPSLIRENEQFWDRTWTNRLVIIPHPKPVVLDDSESYWAQFAVEFFTLDPLEDKATEIACEWYAMTLDNWGVTLQHANDWAAARTRFQGALSLNTNNVAARMNLDYNRDPANGGLTDPSIAAGLLQEMTERRRWTQNLLKTDGPFDGPIMDYALGILFQEVGLPRQAIQLMDRASTLSPDVAIPQLTLAELYEHEHLNDRALEVLHDLRRRATQQHMSEEDITRINLLEAGAWLATTNQAAGERILKNSIIDRPQDDRVFNTVLDIYLQAGELTNALKLLQDRVTQFPDSLYLLTRQAGVLQKSGQYAKALVVLNHCLEITNLPSLYLDRASDRMLTGDLGGAQKDYQYLLDQLHLERNDVDAWRPYYGLAQVALRRHDTNTAIVFLQVSITNAPEDSVSKLLIGHQLDGLLGARHH